MERTRSSGGDVRNTATASADMQYVLPVFCEYQGTWPRWKPSNVSNLEWDLMKAFSGNLSLGQDHEYRDRILNLAPLLAEDSTNPFLGLSKSFSYLLRHMDRDRANSRPPLPRLCGEDGYVRWKVLEDERLLHPSVYRLSLIHI